MMIHGITPYTYHTHPKGITENNEQLVYHLILQPPKDNPDLGPAIIVVLFYP